MESVTIKITADEITTLVDTAEGQVKHREVMVSAGNSQRVEGGNWFDEIKDEELAEALDDLGFGPFGVAGVLNRRTD